MTTDLVLSDAWGDVVSADTGHVFLDRHEDGVRFVILRGPCALCAYVGIPESHPLAGKSYDDVPVDCHGGLTYGDMGTGKYLPSGWWWYGWDYCHSGDYAAYYDTSPLRGFDHSNAIKWTPKAVESDAWDALWSFKKLVRLAEGIQK